MHIDIGRSACIWGLGRVGEWVYEVYNLSPCVVVSNGTWCSAPCGHVGSGTVQQYYPYPASKPATQGLLSGRRKREKGDECVSAEWIGHCLSAGFQDRSGISSWIYVALTWTQHLSVLFLVRRIWRILGSIGQNAWSFLNTVTKLRVQ